jgi:Na+-driven multidrug efflux pump
MHLAFFETMAGVIPVIFLALIVEERVEPAARSFSDYLLPVISAGFLFVGEALALRAVYRGHGSSGLAFGVSIAAAIGAFLLLGDAAIGRVDSIEDPALKRRVGIWAGAVLFVVLGVIVAIGFSAR